uniref:Uncharacterized protein n=1 Tax=Mycena chlorophos TaxID=658473 RepID=A0ABQ0LWU4_MYCCL|nr:predicted protein [Mycena chlorophos]
MVYVIRRTWIISRLTTAVLVFVPVFAAKIQSVLVLLPVLQVTVILQLRAHIWRGNWSLEDPLMYELKGQGPGERKQGKQLHSQKGYKHRPRVNRAQLEPCPRFRDKASMARTPSARFSSSTAASSFSAVSTASRYSTASGELRRRSRGVSDASVTGATSTGNREVNLEDPQLDEVTREALALKRLSNSMKQQRNQEIVNELNAVEDAEDSDSDPKGKHRDPHTSMPWYGRIKTALPSPSIVPFGMARSNSGKTGSPRGASSAAAIIPTRTLALKEQFLQTVPSPMPTSTDTSMGRQHHHRRTSPTSSAATLLRKWGSGLGLVAAAA